MKKLSVLFVFLAAVFLTAPLAAEPSEIPYVSPDKVEAATVNVTFPNKWQCVFGKAAEGWQTAPAGKAIPFSLHTDGKDKGRFNLDSLLPAPGKVKDEAVVYTTFTADSDGFALIGLGCDWWLEAYVNGKFCISTFPDGNWHSNYIATDHPFFAPVKKGENLLAVRVQRGGVSWFFGGGPVTIRKTVSAPDRSIGPWLCEPGETSMTIRFGTSRAVGAGVDYRKQGEEKWQTAYHQAGGQILKHTYHTVRLKDLAPGTAYEYRVVLIDPDKPSQDNPIRPDNGKIYSFKLPDAKQQNVCLFFTADLQFSPEEKQQHLRNLLKHTDAGTCDLLVLGGDMAMDFLPGELFTYVFPELCKVGAESRPVIMLRGNHELRGREADRYLDYFGNADGNSYGLYRYGDTAILVLDSWEDKPAVSKGANYCKYNLDNEFYAEQQEFMQKAMKADSWKNAKRRIVLCHGAPYSHAGYFMSGALQKLTDPWFAGKNPEFKVDLWLAGHTHRYSRSIPGTAKVVTFNKPRSKVHNDGTNYTYPVFTVAGPNGRGDIQVSAFRVDIAADKITVSAFDVDGNCFDKVEIDNAGAIRELISLPHFETIKRH